jgi:hypothetical protein
MGVANTEKMEQTIGDLDDMTDAFPGLMQFAPVSESQLVSHSQPHFPALEFRQAEPCHTLLVEAQVPAYDDVSLGLRLLQAFVVVSFDLNKRAENVLVLVRVFVFHCNVLWFVVDTWL